MRISFFNFSNGKKKLCRIIESTQTIKQKSDFLFFLLSIKLSLYLSRFSLQAANNILSLTDYTSSVKPLTSKPINLVSHFTAGRKPDWKTNGCFLKLISRRKLTQFPTLLIWKLYFFCSHSDLNRYFNNILADFFLQHKIVIRTGNRLMNKTWSLQFRK